MSRISLQFALLSSLTLAGCGGGADLPPTYPASGTVTLDDKPLANVLVRFHPESGRGAESITDENGKFTLTTFNTADGALEGQHQVTVHPMSSDVEEPADPANETGAGLNADGTEVSTEQLEKTAGTTIPEKYQNEKTTDQKFTVTTGGENNFDVKLKSQ